MRSRSFGGGGGPLILPDDIDSAFSSLGVISIGGPMAPDTNAATGAETVGEI